MQTARDTNGCSAHIAHKKSIEIMNATTLLLVFHPLPDVIHDCHHHCHCQSVHQGWLQPSSCWHVLDDRHTADENEEHGPHYLRQAGWNSFSYLLGVLATGGFLPLSIRVESVSSISIFSTAIVASFCFYFLFCLCSRCLPACAPPSTYSTPDPVCRLS